MVSDTELVWRRRRAALCALTLLVAIAIAPCGQVGAQAASELELSWKASADCPDAAWAERRLRERLGREPNRATASALKADAVLARSGERFVLTLHTELGSAVGDRRLEAPACADLAEAAVLMIALAVDAEAVARGEAGAPPSASDDELPPALQPPRPAPPRAPRPLVWAAGGAALGSFGDQPTWGIGALGFVARELGFLRLELAGLWLLPRAGSRAPDVGRVRVSLWALRPTLCAGSTGATLRLTGCMGFELGRVGGVGRSLGESLEDHTFWGAVSLGPRGLWRITPRLGVFVEALAVLPVFQPRFVTVNPAETGGTELYAPAPLVARATLGLEARF